MNDRNKDRMAQGHSIARQKNSSVNPIQISEAQKSSSTPTCKPSKFVSINLSTDKNKETQVIKTKKSKTTKTEEHGWTQFKLLPKKCNNVAM